ncbi:MAG: tetratricopeptide repeat protein [Bdellovibrionia bacterium]
MKKQLVGLGISILSLGSFNYALAQDLESLLEGKGEDSAVQPSQQTRLSFAVSTLLDKVTSEQRVFLRYIEAQQWNKALLQFQPAFAGTAFERTANATALEALIKIKAGLEVSGLEQVLQVAEPKKIHSEILHSLKDSVKEDAFVWEIVQGNWNSQWTEVFGRGAEVRTRLKQITLKTDLEVLKDMASKTPANTRERALIDWQLALSYALNDKADEAAKVLAALLKNTKSPISQDLVNVTAGRLLFQNGYFDAAIRYYEKVEKKSDYWLDAQEELAWSYLRKGQPQNALAVSKTLMNPALKGFVGAESYFVSSLGHLKVCDYPQVIEALTVFPKHFRQRAVDLAALSKGEKQELVNKLIAKMKAGSVSWEQLGKDAHALPRMVNRDHKLNQLLKVQVAFEKEALAAERLYSESLALTGLQGKFEILKNNLGLRVQNSVSASVARVQNMADLEVKDIKRILDKLHIVEAEVIQQVDMAGKLTKHAATQMDVKKGETGAKRADALRFPASSEIWFDELSNFKVDVKKGCQSIKRSM